MDVPADWEEVEPRSDGDSSDSSEVQLVERHENNPQSSVGPTAVRAPPDVRFEMQPAVFDAWLTLQRSSAMQTAKAPIFDILSPSWMKTDHLFKAPSLGMVPAVVLPPDTGNAMPVSGLAAKLAANRLRHTQLVKTDDHVLWEAMKKLKTILLSDPAATKLGRSLVSGVSLLTDEAEWSRSLSDAFAGKAVATLAKRSAALWRFHNWCIDNGLGPAVSATESMIYRYLQWLKEHGAPTTASSFLQAWTFLHFHAGFLGPGVEALSSRVRGAARAMYSLKRPLRQAYPLTVLMIVALENVATLAPYDHWRIIAGHMLLCLGSCSRFGDSIKLASLSVNSHNGLQIVEAESMSYKTARKDRQNKLLPLIGLGRFFSKTPWAAQWMDLRAKYGLTLDPALPAWSEIKQDWLKRRMTTGEAHLFLKEFMASSGFSEEELDRIGCHSLKCTLLSWASKGAYLPISDRLLMGHHLSRENQSAVVYSRDELTRVTVVIYQMLKDVKNKRFKPDASRAERIAHQVDLTDSDSEASDSSDDEAGPEDVKVTPCNVGPRASWDDLPLDELRRLKVHAFSGVAHVTSARDTHRFVCGRKNSKNYGLIPGGSNYADMPICMQCRR